MEKLGFGFMRLPLLEAGDQTSIDYRQLEQMVDSFLAKGFTYFDTAYMYHNFTSEIALRETLVKRHPRESFTVASKLPTMFLKARGDQERIFAEQMQKCGVDYFDYYLLHNLNIDHYRIAQEFDSFNFIRRMKAEGRIRNIGFSFHDKADLLERILNEHPNVDFVQLQINYLDWENPSIQSRLCYEVARAHHVPIVVMEPVKGGTLANLPPNAAKLLQKVNPDLSVVSWAMRFAASLEGVAMVLSGMSNRDQLEDNVSYMKDFTPLSDQELLSLNQALELIKNTNSVACTACRYCVDACPQEIAIPEYFGLYNAEMLSPPAGFSIQKVYYANLQKAGHGKASDCLACGLCENACPQHLPIIDHLKQVSKVFE